VLSKSEKASGMVKDRLDRVNTVHGRAGMIGWARVGHEGAYATAFKVGVAAAREIDKIPAARQFDERSGFWAAGIRQSLALSSASGLHWDKAQ
jgi:hypothetical protein